MDVSVKNIGARGEVVFPNECLRENTKIEKKEGIL